MEARQRARRGKRNLSDGDRNRTRILRHLLLTELSLAFDDNRPCADFRIRFGGQLYVTHDVRALESRLPNIETIAYRSAAGGIAFGSQRDITRDGVATMCQHFDALGLVLLNVRAQGHHLQCEGRRLKYGDEALLHSPGSCKRLNVSRDGLSADRRC